jgi:hypothetical protein
VCCMLCVVVSYGRFIFYLFGRIYYQMKERRSGVWGWKNVIDGMAEVEVM